MTNDEVFRVLHFRPALARPSWLGIRVKATLSLRSTKQAGRWFFYSCPIMSMIKSRPSTTFWVAIFALSSQFFLLAASADAARLRSTGKVSLLRVHNVGTGFGPAGDRIDVEVVIQLNTVSGKSFGFTLRNDANRVAHQGMLDLLRDAFNFNHNVTIVYDIREGNDVRPPDKNGTILRLWLTK